GGEHILAARAAGNPVIVMGLHLANWEIIGPTLIGMGLHDARGFYQPPSSRFDHKLALAARERYGGFGLRAGVGAARAALRLLAEERGVFLIYADDERSGRVSAPLFGRPAPPRANLPTIVRLAWASGAAVIPVYVERIKGARFCVNFLAPVALLPEAGDRHAALEENT